MRGVGERGEKKKAAASTAGARVRTRDRPDAAGALRRLRRAFAPTGARRARGTRDSRRETLGTETLARDATPPVARTPRGDEETRREREQYPGETKLPCVAMILI